jgi:hypothetical protein
MFNQKIKMEKKHYTLMSEDGIQVDLKKFRLECGLDSFVDSIGF